MIKHGDKISVAMISMNEEGSIKKIVQENNLQNFKHIKLNDKINIIIFGIFIFICQYFEFSLLYNFMCPDLSSFEFICVNNV